MPRQLSTHCASACARPALGLGFKELSRGSQQGRRATPQQQHRRPPRPGCSGLGQASEPAHEDRCRCRENVDARITQRDEARVAACLGTVSTAPLRARGTRQSLSCAGASPVCPSAGSLDPSPERRFKGKARGSNIPKVTAKNSLRWLRKQCSIQCNG